MGGTENILAGLEGLLGGVSSVAVPVLTHRANAAYDAELRRKQAEQELQQRINFLPYQTQAENAQTAFKLGAEQPYRLQQIQATADAAKAGDYIPGQDIMDIFGGGADQQGRSIKPNERYNKALLTLLRPKETEAEKLAARNNAKLEKEKPKAKGSVEKTLQGYDELIKQTQEILNDPNLGSATGLLGSKNKLTAGGRRIGANLETVKAKTLLNVLGGLKELSSTGASGFGSLSNVEGETLKNSVASLDRSLATGDFKKNAVDFLNSAIKSRALIKKTYEDTYGEKLEDGNGGSNKDPLGLGL